MNEHHIIIFLTQIFLLLGISRFGGEIFSRIKQPALTAEIMVGIVLGPTVLGHFFPNTHALIFPDDIIQKTMLETVGWLGVFFFLLETGLEIDFSSAWRQKGDALIIAIMGIVVPMIGGFACAWFLPDHYLIAMDHKIQFTLFIATILTVSAMPITVRALHDLNLSKTDLGFLIMSALSVNDIIGWLLFTIIFGFFIQAQVQLGAMAIMFGAAAVFVLFCLTLGRIWSNWAVNFMHVLKLPEPSASLTYIFLLGVLCGAIAQMLGLHALFGFFLAGVMAGAAKSLSEKTRQTIGQIVYAIFVPLFFTSIGLKMDFLKSFDPFLVAFVAIVGIGMRFLGAWIGVTMTRLPKANRSIIAIAHTPGGMMEIVMGLLALQFHLITPTVFTAIVFGALITAMVMGPWLSWAIAQRKQISVFEFFTRRGIIMPLNVKTRDEAIRLLCASAASETGMDEAMITKVVLERENLMGTALEEGIAVPHGRIDGLHKPVIIYGQSFSGLDWNSPDGKASHCVFLILTPLHDDAIQVQILRAIAQVMLNHANMHSILHAKEASEVWGVFQNAFARLYIERKT